MAACDPSGKSPEPLQRLWELIVSTNPYLKQGVGQALPSMQLKLDAATSDDWDDDREQATPGWKQRYGPRTWLVIKNKKNKELYLHDVPSVLRIPYTYINAQGEEETEYLLIGFAGGAGE